MDELENGTLQTLVDYYRNMCSKLEYDFVQYQIKSEAVVRSLRERVEHEHPAEQTNGNGSESS